MSWVVEVVVVVVDVVVVDVVVVVVVSSRIETIAPLIQVNLSARRIKVV